MRYSRFSLVIYFIHSSVYRPRVDSWKVPWRRDRLPTSVFMGFLGDIDSKESACSVGSPGGGHGNPLQDSCLENPHGQRSLAGYSPRGCKESDMTESEQQQAYMSMSVSQSIPPLLGTVSSFSTSATLFLLCLANKFVSTVFLDSTYKQYYTVFVSF